MIFEELTIHSLSLFEILLELLLPSLKKNKSQAEFYELLIKLSIRLTGFLQFCYLYNIWKGIQTKKLISMLFAIKSSFKFPASATSNEVDRVNNIGDEWRHFKNISMLHAFISLAWRLTALLHQLWFDCLSTKTSHHYWNNSDMNWKDLANPDRHDFATHSETQTLFLHFFFSTSLGVAEAGNQLGR